MSLLPPKSQALARIRRERTAVLLVNTRSRRGARLYDRARALLHDRGFTITAAHAVTDPAAQLPTLLPQILAARPPLLVVGSGDGTIATVVDHLAYTDTVLGYLPLGTTNNFGRSLGLPLRLDAAVDVITGGKVADVNLGRANGDLFGNLVSLGVSAVVAERTPRHSNAASAGPATPSPACAHCSPSGRSPPASAGTGWSPRSAHSSTAGTTAATPSPGPRPPTRSFPTPPVNEIQTRDTSRPD